MLLILNKQPSYSQHFDVSLLRGLTCWRKHRKRLAIFNLRFSFIGKIQLDKVAHNSCHTVGPRSAKWDRKASFNSLQSDACCWPVRAILIKQHLLHALSLFRETQIDGLADLLIDLSMYQYMRGLNNRCPFRSMQTYRYTQIGAVIRQPQQFEMVAKGNNVGFHSFTTSLSHLFLHLNKWLI